MTKRNASTVAPTGKPVRKKFIVMYEDGSKYKGGFDKELQLVKVS
jgi:hypothetical protein